MAVAFDGREIPAGTTGEGGGAIFTLSEAAGADAEFTTATGCRVSIGEHSRGVVVSNLTATDPATAWQEGLTSAQQGLDVFAARGIVDLDLSEPQFEHILVYGERGDQVLRIVGVSTLNIEIPPIQAVLRNQKGEVVPQAAPVSKWHESMRYYRRAQLSDDLFDSFRSLWLAFENLLDSFEPQVTGDTEKKWLKRALTRVDEALELKRFLPQVSGNPIDLAYSYFYDEARTHLFHAKASRGPLLPSEQAGNNLFVLRHRRLTDLYLGLLEHVTGVRRPSGGLFKGGFDLMIGFVDVEPVIEVTDDPAPTDPDGTSINPDGGMLVQAPAKREEALEVAFMRVFLARMGASEIAAIERVRKTALRSGGDLVSGGQIEGDLRLGGIAALEIQKGIRVRNISRPKSFAEM
jgi:hypothetical protein